MSEDEIRSPNIVNNPILNSPFEEPKEYWSFEENISKKVAGRRPAGYYKVRKEEKKKRSIATEEFIKLDEVNKIRNRVSEWRNEGYPGATRITIDLLNHWKQQDRIRKLFFCQLEAAETIIWLTEASDSSKQGIVIPKDAPTDPKSEELGYEALRRYACKMATGSGKTIVMAMLIAWSVLNKVNNKTDKRFSDAVLIVCPNLTVKQRLEVLKPSDEKNYYEDFDIVPRTLFPSLSKGRIMITNWHLFHSEDDSTKKGVVKKGAETDTAFCKRVVKDLEPKTNFLVFNDEAHHAYRPAERTDSNEKIDEGEDDIEEATVWINGLDRINSVKGINFCVDMSATPYYNQISGHGEGVPFPWIVLDFGLVDAIESGIVKIPRVPIDSNSGRPIPEFFELWNWIMEQLPWAERSTTRRQPKPESIRREANGALANLASEWKKTFDLWKKSDYKIPPVMIIVCANTDIAELMEEEISSGKILSDLKNEDGKEVTLRIDSKLLNEANSRLDETKDDLATLLRKKVSTVGKQGEKGEQIRCIVSVSMLTEGWDAQNVKQILGLRAFKSQLLCEQVVGRGLRRINYDDFSVPEYVDVYGIPFEVIPIAKAVPESRSQERITTKVCALPERKDFEIRFPRVEGYIFNVKHKIKADVKSIPRLKITPAKDPTETIVKDQVGFKVGAPGRLGPGTEVSQTRDEFYKEHRIQTTIFEIASSITDLVNPEAKQVIFPQVLEIVQEYVDDRVTVPPEGIAKKEEIALRSYRDQIIERIRESIRPDTEYGEAPLLPIIEKYRPYGSTSEVNFRISKDCKETSKSHVSHVVKDSGWEFQVMFQLEKMEEVKYYVKNDHLNFDIVYEFKGAKHRYIPDFIIKLKTNDGSILSVVLEVKGYEREKDRTKTTAMKKWIDAINNHGEFGKWEYLICRNPSRVSKQLSKLVGGEIEHVLTN